MRIAFGGLAGTGKTTLARALADADRAVYLRIDTIEQTLRSSGTLAADVGPAGYMVAYALAEANLGLGHVVVADSVNPLRITRQAWCDVAHGSGGIYPRSRDRLLRPRGASPACGNTERRCRRLGRSHLGAGP
ncbi:MAG TPA: AAA family ATPase [Stellaceae bacterium]|nr:AAA family ATPase [Stellaceae bacterium]